TSNPPLGLAYLAATIKEAGIPYTVIDGTGEALDAISKYGKRDDFMIQGLSFDEITRRIPADTRIIGMGCMFSTLWPLTRDLAQHIREHFPKAFMVLGGEHCTAVPELSLRTAPFDAVVLGEGEEPYLQLTQALLAGDRWQDIPGVGYL